jgi:hypothetical protein
MRDIHYRATLLVTAVDELFGTRKYVPRVLVTNSSPATQWRTDG